MLKSFIDWLRLQWVKYNPFDIEDRIKHITHSMEHMVTAVDNLQMTINRDIAELEYANTQKEVILQQIIDVMPDMVWFKDLSGKYIYANNAIKRGLLMCANPIGLTDAELAEHAKEVFGAENHTFGEKCANSDIITLKREAPSRFLESGKIKGSMLYLEVFKNIVKDQNGKIIGVCGTGRDLTEYLTAVKHMEANCARRCGENDVVLAFKKYEFGEEN